MPAYVRDCEAVWVTAASDDTAMAETGHKIHSVPEKLQEQKEELGDREFLDPREAYSELVP